MQPEYDVLRGDGDRLPKAGDQPRGVYVINS